MRVIASQMNGTNEKSEPCKVSLHCTLLNLKSEVFDGTVMVSYGWPNVILQAMIQYNAFNILYVFAGFPMKQRRSPMTGTRTLLS